MGAIDSLARVTEIMGGESIFLWFLVILVMVTIAFLIIKIIFRTIRAAIMVILLLIFLRVVLEKANIPITWNPVGEKTITTNEEEELKAKLFEENK